MSNEYYNHAGWPAAGSSGASASARAEMDAITAGFALLPGLSGNGSKAVVVNAGGTSLTTTTGTFALAGNFATTGAFNTTFVQGANVSLTLPIVSGLTLATLTGTETLTNKTLVAPALGTPASGVATNLTGTASGLTAGNVTTNANLTGPITSVGNATSVAAQTGTGTTFVMSVSPALTTPNLGIPSAGVLTNCTGTAAGLTAGSVTTNANLTGGVTSVGNAATVVTNANLTGPITSVGNATSVAAQTGTGTTFVMSVSPTLTTPILGTPQSGTLSSCTGYAMSSLTGLGTSVATALAIAVGSNGAFVTRGGDAGTPSVLVGTNISGTAASLTAGNATTAAACSGNAATATNAVTVTTNIASGCTGVTQTAGDNTTKIATTAYADNAATSLLTALNIGWDWGQGAGYGGFSASGSPSISASLNWGTDGSIQLQSDGTNSAWIGTSTNATSPSTLMAPFALANNPTLYFNAKDISGGSSNRWVGFTTNVAFASDPTEGFGFRWGNSGNYFAVVRHSSGDTKATDTGIAVSTSTYHEFKVVVSGGGTLITWYIDGVSVATHNGTMPTGPFGLAAYTETTAGGGPRLRYLRAIQTTR